MSTLVTIAAPPQDNSLDRRAIIRPRAGGRIAEALTDADSGLTTGPEVWLDFVDIQFVDSSDLGALVRFAVRMRQLGKSVHVCRVSEPIEDVFRITRFARTPTG